MEQILSELTIEVNQSCPNRCLFCSSLACENSPRFIALPEVLSLGQQAVELGLGRVCISGGEPLCHPEIIPIVNGLARQGLDISFYTTGLIFDKDNNVTSFNEWDCILDANPTLIFNIQSTAPNVHDKLVGRQGAFNLTKKSMLFARREGLKTEVHIVPNKLNLKTLETTVHDLTEWGVERISFLRIVYQGYARKHLNSLYLDSDDIENLKKIFRNLCEFQNGDITLRFGIPFSGVIEKPRHCNAGCNKLIIRYDGKVLPCEAFKDTDKSEFIIGDIRENKLKEILYNGRNFSNLISLKKQICSTEPCPAQLLYT